jgi:hypothetical protein
MNKKEIFKKIDEIVVNLDAVPKGQEQKVQQSIDTYLKTKAAISNQLPNAQANTKPGIEEEEGGSNYPGSINGTGDSHAFEPKGTPSNGIPSMGAESKPMGMKTTAADSIPIMENDDEEPTKRYEIEDHINDLLKSMFGFKYYFGPEQEEPPTIIQKKDIQGSLFPMKPVSKEEYPYFDKLSNNRKNELLSDREFAQIMKLLDFDKFPEALNALIRMKEKMLSESLLKSKMFSIIAENEAPAISKGDFISYLKSKKNEKFNS